MICSIFLNAKKTCIGSFSTFYRMKKRFFHRYMCIPRQHLWFMTQPQQNVSDNISQKCWGKNLKETYTFYIECGKKSSYKNVAPSPIFLSTSPIYHSVRTCFLKLNQEKQTPKKTNLKIHPNWFLFTWHEMELHAFM